MSHPALIINFKDRDHAQAVAERFVLLNQVTLVSRLPKKISAERKSELEARIRAMFVGAVRREAGRGHLDLANPEPALKPMLEGASETVLAITTNEFIRTGQALMVREALKSGEKLFHGGGLSPSDYKAHDAVRAMALAHEHIDEPICMCAELLGVAASIYADRQFSGKRTFPRTLVKEAADRLRVQNGKIARPQRTAASIVVAAEKKLGTIPEAHKRVMNDYLYYLNGWDRVMTESEFFAKISNRHLPVDSTRHAGEIIDEIVSTARATGGQVGKSIIDGIENAQFDRFLPESYELSTPFPEDFVVQDLDENEETWVTVKHEYVRDSFADSLEGAFRMRGGAKVDR